MTSRCTTTSRRSCFTAALFAALGAERYRRVRTGSMNEQQRVTAAEIGVVEVDALQAQRHQTPARAAPAINGLTIGGALRNDPAESSGWRSRRARWPGVCGGCSGSRAPAGPACRSDGPASERVSSFGGVTTRNTNWPPGLSRRWISASARTDLRPCTARVSRRRSRSSSSSSGSFSAGARTTRAGNGDRPACARACAPWVFWLGDDAASSTPSP